MVTSRAPVHTCAHDREGRLKLYPDRFGYRLWCGRPSLVQFSRAREAGTPRMFRLRSCACRFDGGRAEAMAETFPWTPSTLPQGSYVYAMCQRCSGVRYITRAMMLERVGDVPFKGIDGRLRCIGRREPRGRACGGEMTLALGTSRV